MIPLGVDRLAREHAVTLQQRPRQRSAALRLRGRLARGGPRHERPAPLAARRADAARAKRATVRQDLRLRARGRRPAEVAAQRREGVVGDLARPDQIPESCEEIRRKAAGLGDDVREEERAPLLEEAPKLRGELARGGLLLRRKERELIDEEERDPPIVRPERLDADPGDLSSGAEQIEIRGPVLADARGSTSASSTDAGIGAPWSCSITVSSASGPKRVRWRPCQSARKRPSAAGSTGSTSLRSFASERRLSPRSTSASHHSRDRPPGENSPSSTRSDAASRSSAARTGATPRPKRAATDVSKNGPCVRA